MVDKHRDQTCLETAKSGVGAVDVWSRGSRDAGLRTLSHNDLEQVRCGIAFWATARAAVLFAYLHGSLVAGETSRPRDIDVAVYLADTVFARHDRQGDLEWTVAIPMEMELEERLGAPVDLQLLNRAPLPFRYRVVTAGIVLVDKNPDIRCQFEYLARVEYFDFMPRLHEYLREAAV